MIPVTGKSKAWADTSTGISLGFSLLCPPSHAAVLRLAVVAAGYTGSRHTHSKREILEMEGRMSPHYPPDVLLYLTGLNWAIYPLWSLRGPPCLYLELQEL